MKKIIISSITIFTFFGCSPITYSNLQSAKLVDKGKFEFTPSVTMPVFGEGYNYGIQTAYGMSEKFNLRLRLERIVLDIESNSDSSDFIGILIRDIFDTVPNNFTHLSFGLKYQLYNNSNVGYSSIYLPISFTKADGSKNSMTFIEPTFIYSLSGKYFEITPSIKVLVPIGSQSAESLLAYNLGFGISTNLSKWAILPEFGLLTSLDHKSVASNISLGLSFYP